MRGKIAGAVLSALLFLSPAFSTDKKPEIVSVEQTDSFYAAIQDMTADEIAMLYRKNPSIFVQKYRNFNNKREFNTTLDEKVFEGLSEILYSHQFLNIEEKLYITDENIDKKDPFLLVNRQTINKNHALMIMINDYLFTHASNQTTESLFQSAYTELKKFVDFKPTNNVLLNMSLDKGKLDSFQLATIYYDLGKRYHLPIEIVRARDNFLIQINGDSFFNPLDDKILSADSVIRQYNIAPESIANGMYLKPLTEDQKMSVEFARIGWFCRIQMEILQSADLIDGVFQAFDDSLVLDQNNIDTFMYKGQVFHALEEYDAALKNYSAIISRDPNNAAAHALSGMAYHDKGNDNMAIQSFKKALQFDKNMKQFVPEELKNQVILDGPGI